MNVTLLDKIATTSRGTEVYRVKNAENVVFIAKSVPTKKDAEKEYRLQKKAASENFSPEVYGILDLEGKYFVVMDEVHPVDRPKKLTAKRKEELISRLYAKTGILQRDDSSKNFLFGTTRLDSIPREYMIDFGIVDEA